jgi:uncharacterized protein (DUF1501 family)
MGSIASMEIGNPNNPLPNYVSVGGNLNTYHGAGYLGPRHQPLLVGQPSRGVENLRPLVEGNQFNSRVGLLEELEQGFHKTHPSAPGTAHRTTYQRAVNLMLDQGARAFDINQESAETRARYGATPFGEGCLLARRLVEAGVTFTEVTLGGWDTHNNNFTRVQTLSQTVDNAMSALISDLHERGLLDSTLVLWMGDFGRTPRINSRPPVPGRDHYPRAWSSVMVGGGIRGGQVIGRTDAEAATVEERPVSAMDFMATVCRILGIDYTKFNQTPIGRPIRIADRGATPIEGLI